MSIDSKIAEIMEESKIAGLINEEEAVEEVVEEVDELPEEISAEEFEQLPEEIQEMYQLDELSKKTLGSYVKKASKDASNKTLWGTVKSGHKKGEGDSDFSKAEKRQTGIARAADKLTKEELSVDVSEDVAALINGETLSEEFKTKAATIFEAAVVTRVKEEVTRLEEEFDAKLAEQVESITEGLVEKIDGYLDYVVEQWMEQNEIALQHGVKGDIMESFITGMRDLFKEHYIDIPEEKYDVIGEMESKIDELSTKLDEQVERNVEMKKIISESVRKEIVHELSEGLTVTDSEKFHALVEELSYEDQDSFKVKVQTIRENYFTGKTSTLVESVVTDAPIEEVAGDKYVNIDPSVAAYVQALKKLNQ